MEDVVDPTSAQYVGHRTRISNVRDVEPVSLDGPSMTAAQVIEDERFDAEPAQVLPT